jgi:hypothetical protein
MVTRSRDLDAFSWADPNDVRLADFRGGLQFACIGQIPERRLLLESVYGFLTLRNGIPVGYVLTGSLFRSSEVAYNVFETYRGTEAAAVYGKALAMTRHLFGADTFMVPPYQLGEGNDEALQSGAWWFYQKLGFRPRDAATTRLMTRELARMRRKPGHRSSRATLERLSATPLFWSSGPRRGDVMGALPLANVGVRVSEMLAERYGSERDRARSELAREALSAVGLASDSGFTPGERLAWERWAPVIVMLPGIGRWTPGEKRALVQVVRAKGGKRESDFVRLFDRHAKLQRAVRRLATGAG